MKNIISRLTLILAVLCPHISAASNSWVNFNSFSYSGWDNGLTQAKGNGYFNPIQPGFYPDPSVVRVGNTYYMTHSTFAFFPGLPVFKSHNLVDWEQIGHALWSTEQLAFNKQQDISHGIFAPTLRYHQGMFYIITTDVYGIGNFIISAKDPAGTWSKPIVLPEVGGIDPDLFFDDDGKVYVAHNDAPEGKPRYSGHRAIWLWELDWAKKAVIPSSRRLLVDGGANINEKPVWIEGPHIIKKDGWYYLICAEGGTSVQHSQVVFRTRDLNKPFIPYSNNPILTQRDLDPKRPNPITSVGHADFVQTPNGDWWTVFLGIRPYKDNFHNTGRETFLLPLTWKNGWPHILDKKAPVPSFVATNALGKLDNTQSANQSNWVDNFTNTALGFRWVTARTNSEPFYRIDAKNQHLQLRASQTLLSSKDHSSMLVARQQHLNVNITAELQLPQNQNIQAGIINYQNDAFHYFFYLSKTPKGYSLVLETVNNGTITRNSSTPITPKHNTIKLGMEQRQDMLNFYYFDNAAKRVDIAKHIDATLVSTHVAGGFTGAMLGIHARAEVDKE